MRLTSIGKIKSIFFIILFLSSQILASEEQVHKRELSFGDWTFTESEATSFHSCGLKYNSLKYDLSFFSIKPFTAGWAIGMDINGSSILGAKRHWIKSDDKSFPVMLNDKEYFMTYSKLDGSLNLEGDWLDFAINLSSSENPKITVVPNYYSQKRVGVRQFWKYGKLVCRKL